ncbi:hypothetical protein D5S17_29130 [Pseudonocardiaceae bacterium YIM PH 21723]|nr:hypothetical protein D5S17_29130 [Pseudonocardiaceae bacterium YIM PH 21723]
MTMLRALRVLIALLLVFAAAETAHAEPYAERLTTTLTAGRLPDSPTMTRTVHLAAGSYTWTVAVIDPAGTTHQRSRGLIVADSGFDWTCVLETADGRYRSNCRLDDHKFRPAYLTSEDFVLDADMIWTSEITG